MTTTLRRAGTAVVAVAAAVALAGCSDPPSSGSNQPNVPNAGSVAPGPAGDAQRESIGQTSQQDLAAALRANDVSDPDNWAQILLQYKPYPPGADGTAKIRQVLTQFKADPDTISRITNVVTP
jgi:hypothetical protein